MLAAAEYAGKNRLAMQVSRLEIDFLASWHAQCYGFYIRKKNIKLTTEGLSGYDVYSEDEALRIETITGALT